MRPPGPTMASPGFLKAQFWELVLAQTHAPATVLYSKLHSGGMANSKDCKRRGKNPKH